MSHVLVTGATGFIGNHVVLSLLRQNHRVSIISRKNRNEIKSSWIKSVELYTLDLHEKLLYDIDLVKKFGNPDVLIHLAWDGLPNYFSTHHLTTNLSYDVLFVKNLIQNGIQNINIAGTCFEYGFQEGELKETFESQPNNYYSLAKDTLRKYIEIELINKNISYKWLRIFYPYGLDQNPKSLYPSLVQAILNKSKEFNLSDKNSIRDFIHVVELAEIIVKISLQEKVNGIINCSSGNPTTIENFANGIKMEFNSDIKLNFGVYPSSLYESKQYWGNAEKRKIVYEN